VKSGVSANCRICNWRKKGGSARRRPGRERQISRHGQSPWFSGAGPRVNDIPSASQKSSRTHLCEKRLACATSPWSGRGECPPLVLSQIGRCLPNDRTDILNGSESRADDNRVPGIVPLIGQPSAFRCSVSSLAIFNSST
jgi:hypothetical protein